jgi:hypothetical protein
MGSLPTPQISIELFALFEKIYDGEPILAVISKIEEDVQYRWMGPALIFLKISA